MVKNDPEAARLIYQRIEAKLKSANRTAREVSIAAGVGPDGIRTIKQGKMPGSVRLGRIAHEMQTTISELTGGRPEILSDDDKLTDERDYVNVRTISARWGMGGGGYVDEDAYGEPVLLPRRLIESDLRGKADDFLMIDVEGLSMQPVFLSGDQLLIDTRKKNPSDGGVFALWDGFSLVVKWVERVPKSDPPAFAIKSYNEMSENYESLAEETQIAGRVVWFARKL